MGHSLILTGTFGHFLPCPICKWFECTCKIKRFLLLFFLHFCTAENCILSVHKPVSSSVWLIWWFYIENGQFQTNWLIPLFMLLPWNLKSQRQGTSAKVWSCMKCLMFPLNKNNNISMLAPGTKIHQPLKKPWSLKHYIHNLLSFSGIGKGVGFDPT